MTLALINLDTCDPGGDKAHQGRMEGSLFTSAIMHTDIMEASWGIMIDTDLGHEDGALRQIIHIPRSS